MTRLKLINYALFQIGWFACVWGAANGKAWLGPVVVLIAVAWHLNVARRPGVEIGLMLSCAALGLIFDSLLLQTAWVTYKSAEWLPLLAPYWIIALWVLFATTLNLSMNWIRGHSGLAFLLGAIGGPASYLAGQSLGAMEMVNQTAALIMLAIGWGVMMPALALLATRLNGFAPVISTSYVLRNWTDSRVPEHV